MILLHSAGHPPLSAKSSSSNLNDPASHGSRVKAKKSRGVGISAEPQTLQNLQVRYLRLCYYIIEWRYFLRQNLGHLIKTSYFCQDISNVKFAEVKKDEKTRKILHGAIMDNDFMKNLEPGTEMITLWYSWAIIIISTFWHHAFS